MLHNDLVSIALYIGFIIGIALPILLLKFRFNLPFEISRKMLHLMITMQIFPLVKLFSTWQMAVLAAFTLVILAYPILALVEDTPFYKRVAVERRNGEFKQSLIIIQVSVSLLIFIYWGLLGDAWKYVAVVAVMAWGFGDAAAALVGKAFGRRRILHRFVDRTKTVEGTQAMYFTAGLAVFLTLLIYAGQPWFISLLVALLVAPVCTVVELVSRRGMDTLTVPISASIAILASMTLISFLGI